MTERDDLPQDPALSRLYRQHTQDEPPAALDAAILDAAQRATRPRRRPWWLRLQVPVALAATLMLTVMLTLTMERNPPPAADLPDRAPAPAAAPAPAETSTQGATAPAPAAKAVREREARRAATRQDRSPPASDAGAMAGAAEPPTVPAGPVGNQAAPAPAPSAQSASDELREERKVLAAPAPAAAAPAPAMADRALAKREKTIANPAEWIEEIRALRRKGATQEAERRLREFRTAFPDYPLPDDLR